MVSKWSASSHGCRQRLALSARLRFCFPAQARDELQQPPHGRERPAWMDPPDQAHQSLPAPAPPRAPAEDGVSSRLAALKARLAAEKSKSSSRQHEHRRRVVLTAAVST